MKSKQNVSSQFLILALAALVIVFMIQVAKAESDAQSTKLAQSNLGQSRFGVGQSEGPGQVLQIKMPQKNLARRILESTTLTYYHQFSGPTMSGGTETYNVFQEGVDIERSGRAPLQSFHAANLRFQLSEKWAIGASIAAANGYTGEVENRGGVVNTPEQEWFNARAYVVLPPVPFKYGTFFTTLSYEAPTSNISKEDDMKWGWVLNETLAFNLPNKKWSAGLMGQYWRAYYGHSKNVKPPAPGYMPTQLQTVIVSGGPYASYRFNDHWGLGSVVTFDWDQRGVQTDSKEFNNNLPHRGRINLTYYPSIKYVSNVGLFATGPLKFRPDTTALGADFGLKF